MFTPAFTGPYPLHKPFLLTPWLWTLCCVAGLVLAGAVQAAGAESASPAGKPDALINVSEPFGPNARLEIIDQHGARLGRLIQRGSRDGVHYVFDQYGNGTFGIDPEFRESRLNTFPDPGVPGRLQLEFSVLNTNPAGASRRVLWKTAADRHVPLSVSGLALTGTDLEILQTFELFRRENSLNTAPDPQILPDPETSPLVRSARSPRRTGQAQQPGQARLLRMQRMRPTGRNTQTVKNRQILRNLRTYNPAPDPAFNRGPDPVPDPALNRSLNRAPALTLDSLVSSMASGLRSGGRFEPETLKTAPGSGSVSKSKSESDSKPKPEKDSSNLYVVKPKPARKKFTFNASIGYPLGILGKEGVEQSPALKLSLKYSPKPGWSVSGGASVPFAAVDPWEGYSPQYSDFWYSFGFDYWKSPFSATFSNYGPNKIDNLLQKNGGGAGDANTKATGIANPFRGSLALGYKFGLKNDQMGSLALDETSKIGCKAGANINPLWTNDAGRDRYFRTGLTLGCRYTVLKKWYIEAQTKLYAPGQRKSSEGDFTWGFGYADYRPGKLSLTYSNYAASYFPGRGKPLTNILDGTLTLSSGWKF